MRLSKLMFTWSVFVPTLHFMVKSWGELVWIAVAGCAGQRRNVHQQTQENSIVAIVAIDSIEKL